MKSVLQVPLLCLLLAVATAPASAQHVIATIPVGHGPASVVVNQKTNRVYVGNMGDQSVSVIDGSTNVRWTNIFVNGANSNRTMLAYWPTNQIFVGDPDNQQVDIIDGKTNTVGAFPAEFSWVSQAAQLGTSNRLYIGSGSQISVVDANDLSVVTSIPVPYVLGVAANSTTGLVYASSYDPDSSTWSIAVIDSNTNTLVNSFPLGAVDVFGISVDSTTNRLFVGTSPHHSLKGSVSALDGTSGALLGTTQILGQIESLLVIAKTTNVVVGGGKLGDRQRPDSLIFIDTGTLEVKRVVRVGAEPVSIAYNPVTKRIYVTNSFDGTLSVLGN